MRFLALWAVFMGLLLTVVPTRSMAQTYYNAPNSSGSGTLYNAPSGGSYGSHAPLNIKGMVQGDTKRASARTGYTYQGKPYGVDRSSYSLALTPDQARQNQIKRARVSADREREKKRQRLAMEKSSMQNIQANTQVYLNQFQSDTVLNERNTQAQRKRVLYNQNSSELSVPKRVFNSPY